MGSDRKISLSAFVGLSVAALATAAAPQPAAACGGLFCNTAQPVNQTAERILFVDNGDDTTTAVIEIRYAGPSDRFAWLLPVSDIEDPDNDIKVGSTALFDTLQRATNPQYTLNRRVVGDCDSSFISPLGSIASSADSSGRAFDGSNQGPTVNVEASGSVGPYDFELLSVDGNGEDEATVAIEWLADNEYDLGELGADVLRPYLAEDMKLLAVRLTKGNDAGAVRPLSIRYPGAEPSIPIRPTAVAAEDDMGIMVWVGGEHRAVPVNYRTLVLNEALINWFNPGSTYNDVIVAAADEAGGQGFVTEYAGAPETVVSALSFNRDSLTASEESLDGLSGTALLNTAINTFRQLDGLPAAVERAATLPAGVTGAAVVNCPSCQIGDAAFALDEGAFRAAIHDLVVQPAIDFLDLLDKRPYLTRLYTTMSAEEMTVDPIFGFNADLEDMSNVHVAEQIILCSSEYDSFSAPYYVQLENGDRVHGLDQGTWPVSYDADTMPANRIIAQATTTGALKTMVDNSPAIDDTLRSLPRGQGSSGLCSVSAPGQGASSAWLLALPGLALLSRRRGRRR